MSFGWLRKAVPAIVGLVGFVFVVNGGFVLLSQGWSQASGTVGACTPRLVRTGSSSHTEQTCQVTWRADGQTRTAAVDLGAVAHPGETVDLRVNGDTVAFATPAWVGAAVGGGGLALVAVAVVLFVRGRRRRAAP